MGDDAQRAGDHESGRNRDNHQLEVAEQRVDVAVGEVVDDPVRAEAVLVHAGVRAPVDLDLGKDLQPAHASTPARSTASISRVSLLARNCAMSSTESTPITLPRASTTGPYCVSSSSSSARALRSTESWSSTGVASVSARSAARSRSLSHPSGLPSPSISSG